jgi:hypothetical protein
MPAWHMAASVVKSYEAMSDGVVDDYLFILNRAPDRAGMTVWTNALQHGGGDEDLLASLAGSDEHCAYTQAN